MRSWQLSLYIALLVILALVLVASALFRIELTLRELVQVAAFVVLVIAANLFPIHLRRVHAEITVGTAILIAGAVLFGPGAAVVIALVGTLVEFVLWKGIVRSEQFPFPWNRIPFNVALQVICFAGLAATYQYLADQDPRVFDTLTDLGALGVGGIVYFVLNQLLVSEVIALDERTSLISIWRMTFRDVVWHEMAMVPLGATVAILWNIGAWALALAFLPLYIVRQAIRQVRQVAEQTKEALIAMADTIDARDITTYQHSQRVARYVEMIARQMRVPFDQIDVMVTATRLHDLGKIGMSNEMLYKPGPFTPEERRIFRQHTIIGDDLVAKFPGFEAGRALVRDHHERFDGTGYPSGKKGTEIALGARILAVADAYDAMTSDRPYRKALSHEKAVAELRANRGSQFDPEVVDAFLKALEARRVPGERTYVIAPSPAHAAEVGSHRGDG